MTNFYTYPDPARYSDKTLGPLWNAAESRKILARRPWAIAPALTGSGDDEVWRFDAQPLESFGDALGLFRFDVEIGLAGAPGVLAGVEVGERERRRQGSLTVGREFRLRQRSRINESVGFVMAGLVPAIPTIC